MRFSILLFTTITSLLFIACTPSPKRAATKFMNNVKDKKFVAAAECCGVSKDKESLDIMTAILKEKYGMKENTIRAFAILHDSILPDKQNAIVTMNILYTDLHREDSVSLKMRTMDGKWIVQPFQ